RLSAGNRPRPATRRAVRRDLAVRPLPRLPRRPRVNPLADAPRVRGRVGPPAGPRALLVGGAVGQRTPACRVGAGVTAAVSGPPPGVALVYDRVYPFAVGGVEHRNDQIARRLAGRRPVALYGFAYWRGDGSRRRPGVGYVSVGAPRSVHTTGGKRRLRDALAA